MSHTHLYSCPITRETALLDPMRRASPDGFERLSADDVFEIGASGCRVGKAEAMAMFDAESGVRFESDAIETGGIAQGVVPLRHVSTHRNGADAGPARRSLHRSSWMDAPENRRVVFPHGAAMPDAGASP